MADSSAQTPSRLLLHPDSVVELADAGDWPHEVTESDIATLIKSLQFRGREPWHRIGTVRRRLRESKTMEAWHTAAVLRRMWKLGYAEFARHNGVECVRITKDPPLTQNVSAEDGFPRPSEPNSIPTDRKLAKRFEAAYQSFETAAKSADKLLSDQEAYNWLKENGPAEYELPEFQTWQRYVRQGRAFYGMQKNAPRGGRKGRSIVSANDNQSRHRCAD